jgi:hypothetical protein
VTEPKTYQGGCHCGRVRYEITTALVQVTECNCSICMKRGALWTFVKASQFKLLQGHDALAEYQLAKSAFITCFANRAVSAPSRKAKRRTARTLSRSMRAASTTSTFRRSSACRSTARSCSAL